MNDDNRRRVKGGGNSRSRKNDRKAGEDTLGLMNRIIESSCRFLQLVASVDASLFSGLVSSLALSLGSFFTLNRLALMATTIVLTVIKTAPAAGLSRMPCLYNTPAASGNATTL